MKKVILSLLFIVFLMSSQASFAQISVGIKGGLNDMWVSPRPNNESNSFRVGFTIGAFARFKIPVVGLYVQPELMFGQKGGKMTYTGGSFTTKLSNLEIPVLLGKSFAAGLFRVYLGPQFNFVLGAKYDATATFAGTSITTSGNLKDIPSNDYNNFYLSGQVGIGFDIKKLTIDLNWQPALGNFYKKDGNYKPQAIQLTVGWKFM